MLTILRVVPETKKKIFKKIWTDIAGPKPAANLKQAGGVSYIEITVEACKRGIPWKKVEVISLDCAGKMLLPKNVFPPKSSAVTRFVPKAYPKLLLYKLFISVLKNSQNKGKISVAVYDEGIEYKHMLEIVRNAGEIKFLTDKPYSKLAVQEKIIEETGASVTFTDDYDAADRCAVIYAPNGLPFSILGNKNALVFAPKGRCNGTVIKSADVDIPDCLKEVYNDMYDRLDFMSAFYEIGESKAAENVNICRGFGFYSSFTAEELSKILDSGK